MKLPEPNDLPSLCRSVLISVTFSEPITLGSVSQETLTVMLLGPKNMGEPSSLMVTSQVPSADFAFTMRCDISVCIHMRVQPPAQISAIARMICSTMCAALCEYPSVINVPTLVSSCHSLQPEPFHRSLKRWLAISPRPPKPDGTSPEEFLAKSNNPMVMPLYLWETNMPTVSVVGVIAEACDLRKWPISMHRVMKRYAVSRVIRACRIFKDQV